MKNIIFIIIIIICGLNFINCKTQTISLTRDNHYDIPNGAYVKDYNNKLEPFVGTWKWTDGTNELIIRFVKVEMYNASGTNPYHEDIIMGGYKFTQGSSVIVNTLTFNTTFNPNDISSFNNYAPLICHLAKPYNKLSIQFYDKTKNKSCYASLELVDPLTLPNGQLTSSEAEFKLWNKENWNIDGNNPIDQSFILPTNGNFIKL